MTYKYTDATKRIVTNGNGWSGRIEAPKVQAWLSEGNMPEPADIPPPPTVQEQLATLDADNTLTQRNLRETVMLMTEAFKTVTNGAVDLSAIPGVAKVYEVEAQAETLRAQL